jgi:hypothetical protein
MKCEGAMVGKCRLCLQDGVILKRSHYLPAGVYRLLRDSTGLSNPNPYQLTGRGSVQTSKQQREFLLCNDCEQRLCKQGESWVLAHAKQSTGAFALEAILSKATPSVYEPGNPTKLYETALIPEVNRDAILYFAASIFWRGSIHGWNDDGSVPVNLYSYKEQFRRFLMGDHPFPKSASLWVIVRDGEEISQLTYTPSGRSRFRITMYRFTIPGFVFMLSVGAKIPDRLRQYCLLRGAGNPVVQTMIAEPWLMAEAREKLQQGMKARQNRQGRR